ncbi:MAG: hypothetical protein K2X81_01625 [Candidatus Obscuribacterales bacterium]|nr:hypothetical protein [Candidatus Obscuribacterales bacterium]
MFSDRERKTFYLLANRKDEETSDKQGLRLFIGLAGKKMLDLPVTESRIERSLYGKATYKTPEGTFETSWITFSDNRRRVASWSGDRSGLCSLDLNDYNVRVTTKGIVKVTPKLSSRP